MDKNHFEDNLATDGTAAEENQQKAGSGGIFQIPVVFDTIAEVAERRAARRAATLPMILGMGANALAIEMRIWAEDQEKILASAGISATSPLRALADILPSLARRGASIAVAAETKVAETLRLLTNLNER